MIFIPDIDNLEPDVTVGDYGHQVMHEMIHWGLKSLKDAVVSLSASTVTVSGNQAIQGTKTFTKPVGVPLTTASTIHPASKKYVDDTGANTQPSIATGSIVQYYRGDKTWATLNATTAGVGLLNNTSDINKPISTAQQTALDLKQDAIAATSTSYYFSGDKTFRSLGTTAVGLAAVDNTSDLAKPISTAQQAALNGKQATIATGETFQYYRGDKTWVTLDSSKVGLNLVNNTSDLDKPISVPQQNALDLKASRYTTVSKTVYDLIPGNKTFVKPPKLSGASTAGYVWTATTVDGVGVVGGWKPKGTLVTTVDYNNTTAGRPVSFPPIIGTTADTAAAGDHTHTKAAVGLGNVDNTSDVNKPVSSATQTALNQKASNTRQLITSASFTPVGAIDSNKSITIANGGIGLTDMSTALKTESIMYIVTFGVRSVGYGSVPDGFTVPFNMNVISVRYRIGTIDGSGSTTAALLKNGGTVTGTSAIGSFNPAWTNGSWSYSEGDNLSVYISQVGTNPGARLIAEILYIKT